MELSDFNQQLKVAGSSYTEYKKDLEEIFGEGRADQVITNAFAAHHAVMPLATLKEYKGKWDRVYNNLVLKKKTALEQSIAAQEEFEAEQQAEMTSEVKEVKESKPKGKKVTKEVIED